LGLGRTQNWLYFGNGDFCDALKLIDDLLSLVVFLKIVVNVLPFAATAGAKVGAKRLDAVFGIFMKVNRFTFHKRAFPFGDPYIDHVTWGNIGYKNDFSFVVAYTFPFGCNSLDLQVGNDLVFHFSGHGRKIREKRGI
jgi:hypothetical protein